MQHYVIKFVSDLRQLSGFLSVLLFPLPIKLTSTIQLKFCNFVILLKVALNTITQPSLHTLQFFLMKPVVSDHMSLTLM
jgi:hypothetical protein